MQSTTLYSARWTSERHNPPPAAQPRLLLFGKHDDANNIVFESKKAYDTHLDELNRTAPNEALGLYFGRHCITPDGVRHLLIVGCLLVAAKATNVTAEITTEQLAQAIADGNSRWPGTHPIGFYHSHPNFSTNESGVDAATRKRLFADDNHVSMIFNPLADPAPFSAYLAQSGTRVTGHYVLVDAGPREKTPVHEQSENLSEVIELLQSVRARQLEHREILMGTRQLLRAHKSRQAANRQLNFICRELRRLRKITEHVSLSQDRHNAMHANILRGLGLIAHESSASRDTIAGLTRICAIQKDEIVSLKRTRETNQAPRAVKLRWFTKVFIGSLAVLTALVWAACVVLLVFGLTK